MKRISNILALWPSHMALANDLKVPYETAKSWRRRGSIPSAHWARLIAAAQKRHINITADDLVKAA